MSVMSVDVKTRVFSHFRKNPSFDVNIFPQISKFYGDGLLLQTNDYFSVGFAWLWYNPEIHILRYFGLLFDDIHTLIYRDVPVFNMGDGFMKMDDYSFSCLLDIEIDYEEFFEVYDDDDFGDDNDDEEIELTLD